VGKSGRVEFFSVVWALSSGQVPLADGGAAGLAVLKSWDAGEIQAEPGGALSNAFAAIEPR
jgi:hypothetical protein